MTYGTIRGLAFVGALIFVGILALPEYAFFLFTGLGAGITGLIIRQDYQRLGWILIVAGPIIMAYGGKRLRDHMQASNAEAEKALEEVRRRFRR